MDTQPANSELTGLRYWMQEVLRQCELASADFSEDSVHDLRVALRRCRSLADGLMCFDPSVEWRQMKRSGKSLFAALGKLRDAQVMVGWVEKLFESDDPAAGNVLRHCHAEIEQAKQAAVQYDRQERTVKCVSQCSDAR